MDEKNELARQEIELINEQTEVYTDLIDDKAKEPEVAEKTEQEQLSNSIRSACAVWRKNGSYTYLLDILFQCAAAFRRASAIDMIG